jgi:hypothetical protein
MYRVGGKAETQVEGRNVIEGTGRGKVGWHHNPGRGPCHNYYPRDTRGEAVEKGGYKISRMVFCESDLADEMSVVRNARGIT